MMRSLLTPAMLSDADILPLLNARRIRRMSDYVKITLARRALCLQDAGHRSADAAVLGLCKSGRVLGTRCSNGSC